MQIAPQTIAPVLWPQPQTSQTVMAVDAAVVADLGSKATIAATRTANTNGNTLAAPAIAPSTMSTLLDATQTTNAGQPTQFVAATNGMDGGIYLSGTHDRGIETNLTTSDYSFMNATLGVRAVHPVNPTTGKVSTQLIQIQDANGDNITNSALGQQWFNMGLDISMARTGGELTGDITSSSLKLIAHNLPTTEKLSTSQMISAQEWLDEQNA